MSELRHLTRTEIDEITERCCLNGELFVILEQLAFGKSIVQIAFKTGLSTRSVDRRIEEIKRRMAKM